MGLTMVDGERFVLKAEEMQILQGKDRVVRNGYRGRKDHHGSGKVKGNSRLASPYYGQAGSRLSQVWKFLLTLYSGILRGHSTAQQTPEER